MDFSELLIYTNYYYSLTVVLTREQYGIILRFIQVFTQQKAESAVFLHSLLANKLLFKNHMSELELNFLSTTKKSDHVDKNEHKLTNKCNNLVAADVLKTAEIRMQNKGMLPGGTAISHNPLWFLVETEKNVYLWRSGHSLEEKQDFEFWVDLEALIDKRIAQLERSDFKDPLQHLFKEFELGGDLRCAETDYLQALRDNFKPILSHLAALSEIQKEILEEGLGQQQARVVLPLVKHKP